jgi:hypothetical protein
MKKRPAVCSICRRELAEGEGVTFEIREQGAPPIAVGLYCSGEHRDMARAVGLILDAPLGASRDLRERRERIADDLLAAWRRGEGPDVADVLFAAEYARA